MLSLNHCYKTSHYSLQVGTDSFSRQEPAVSPIAWQSNKAILFYFAQNSVSKIQFSTSTQEAEILASYRLWGIVHSSSLPAL